MSNKNLTIGLLITLVISIGAYAFPRAVAFLGANATGPLHYSLETFLQGVQIGQRGTPVVNNLEGTCALLGANLSVAATSTQAFDCAVTGARVNDRVVVSLATTSVTSTGTWLVAGASASSTSNYITVKLLNLTGAAASPASAGNAAGGFASSTIYRVSR